MQRSAIFFKDFINDEFFYILYILKFFIMTRKWKLYKKGDGSRYGTNSDLVIFLFQLLTFVEEDYVKNRKMLKKKKRQWSVETFITLVIIKDI